MSFVPITTVITSKELSSLCIDDLVFIHFKQIFEAAALFFANSTVALTWYKMSPKMFKGLICAEKNYEHQWAPTIFIEPFEPFWALFGCVEPFRNFCKRIFRVAPLFLTLNAEISRMQLQLWYPRLSCSTKDSKSGPVLDRNHTKRTDLSRLCWVRLKHGLSIIFA